jgi:hypothetical protein
MFGIGCTTIGSYAFCGCSALASVTLPPTLKSIGWYAFEDCAALATVAIPRGCRVDKDAFGRSKTRVANL